MQRRIVAWVAFLGIAFNALWPLLANAAPADIFATICTADKKSQAAQQSPAQKIPASSSLPHCPFCPGVSDSTPALTSTPATFHARVVSAFSAMIAGTAPAASFTYSAAAPRGPPSLR